MIRELIALPWRITGLYQVNCPVQVIRISPQNILSSDRCLMTAARQRSRPSKSLTWKIEAAQSGSRPSWIQFDPEMAPMGSLTSCRQVLQAGFWTSGLLRKLPSLSQGHASFNCGKVYVVLKEKVHILTIKVGMMNVYMLCLLRFLYFWNVLSSSFHDLPWSSMLCHSLRHMHSIHDAILRHFECLLLFLLSSRLCHCTNSYAFPLMFVIAMPFYIWTLLVYINSR